MSIVTFRTFSNAAVVAALVIAATGCKKKVDVPDAAADAAAEVDAAPAAEASNEADVTRLPDETKLDHVAATTQIASSNVRKSPPSGAVITTLPKGTNVVEIAQHDKFFLVTFDDPKDATKKLEGWIVQDAFSTVPPKKKPASLCPAGQTLLIADQDFCGHVCTSTKDCPTGQACSGQANTITLDGGLGQAVSTCTVVNLDAGVVAAVDAGVVAAVDAGTRPSIGGLRLGVLDAGAAVPGQTIPGIQQPPGAGGACPASFALADDKLCRHTCIKNGDCGGTALCKSKHAADPHVGLCFP